MIFDHLFFKIFWYTIVYILLLQFKQIFSRFDIKKKKKEKKIHRKEMERKERKRKEKKIAGEKNEKTKLKY